MKNETVNSSAPIVLGLIGSLLSLSSAFFPCSYAQAVASASTVVIDESAGRLGSPTTAMNAAFMLNLAGALMGSAASLLYIKTPKISGIVLLAAVIPELCSMACKNVPSVLAAISFLVAGAVAVSQKKTKWIRSARSLSGRD